MKIGMIGAYTDALSKGNGTFRPRIGSKQHRRHASKPPNLGTTRSTHEYYEREDGSVARRKKVPA